MTGYDTNTVYTSNQDLVDVNSISQVCCKANQSWKPPVRQEIRALVQDRKTWKSMEMHTLLLLFSREQRTLFLDLIQVTCVVGCTPLNENVLTSLLLIKRMIKTKWTTIVLFPCYQRYLRSKSTALPHVSFHSSGTVCSLYNMVSCRENLVRLNSFK